MMQFNYMKQKQDEIDRIKSELEWWQRYGEFIAVNYSHANAEAIEFADGDEQN